MMIDMKPEAASSETEPERLRQIFEEARRLWLSQPRAEALDVLKYLAANPSTPQNVLLRLAARFPHQFLSNPLLPLLHLEDPDFAHHLPRETMRGLLCADTIPLWLLQGIDGAAKRDPNRNKNLPDIGEALANHVQRVGEAGDNWRSRAESEMQAQVQQQAVAMKSERRPHGVGPAHAALKADLVAPWLSKPLLEALSSTASSAASTASQSPAEASAVAPQQQARRAEASPAELRALAQDEARPVRVAVARHPQASRNVLDRLAEDADPWVRGAVARNENAPSAVLEKLARDGHSVVRATAARHPRTPLRSLELLALDNDLEVLAALQHRADLPASIAQVVQARQKQNLRWSTSRPPEQQARDPQTPAFALEQLALSPDASRTTKCRVGRNRRANRRTLEALARDTDARFQRAVARNPSAPAEILLELASDLNAFVRQAVAANRSLPAEGVQRVFEKFGPSVQEKDLFLATQRGLSLHITSGAGSQSWYGRRNEIKEFQHQDSVLRNLAGHPNAPPDLKRRAGELRQQALLLWLAGSEQVWERAAALSSPTTPPLVLQENLSQPRWEWRFAIARSPNAPRDCLETLARDGNRWVRAGAQANLRGENVSE